MNIGALTGRIVDNYFATEKKYWNLLMDLVILGVISISVYGIVSGYAFSPILRDIHRHYWGRLIERPCVWWFAMGTFLISFRTVLWMRYRDSDAATMSDAPTITVIIPAYNEGFMVERSIESVVNASYPADKLEIMVIDDGSTDDTWDYIQLVCAKYPGRINAVRQPKNMGKRKALEEGFRNGKGEIYVTIDSDSTIDKNALLSIAGPFKDVRTGAVAGKVEVYNREEGIIPKMLEVRYALSFDLLRAVQSTYHTVYCCPGALTAYRASAVHEVLDAWSTQTFWGVDCTYGEDRAMTNHILNAGYNTLYQRSAIVQTVAPVTYKKLWKMFLRWDRSYVREEMLFLSNIVWKRPLKSRIIALFDSFITNLRYPIGLAVMILFFILAYENPWVLVRTLTAIGVTSMFYNLYYLRNERSWKFLYGIVYAYYSCFTLFWVFPYAIFTLRAKSWLTR